MLCNITDCSLIENNLRCKLWHSVPLPFPFCTLSSFVPVRLRMLNPSTCTSTTNNYPTPHIFSNIFGRLPSRIWMTSVAHPPPLNSPSTLFLKDKIECKRFQVSAKELQDFRVVRGAKRAGTQDRNLHPARWHILFCGPTQEPVLARATGQIGRGFGKNAGEWTGRVEISKEETPGRKRSMYGYTLTYSWL